MLFYHCLEPLFRLQVSWCFMSHYVLCFSGCALFFEVVKNLELCDAFIKANKTTLFVALFLVPVGLAILRYLITSEYKSQSCEWNRIE